MTDDNQRYSITDLAREFDITTRTIRFYEDKHLLKPQRVGQQRIYTRADRTRLKLILRGKRLGWPLDDIAELLLLFETPDGEKRQLQQMLQKIERSRSLLLSQQEDIKQSLLEFNEVEQRCRQRLALIMQEEHL